MMTADMTAGLISVYVTRRRRVFTVAIIVLISVIAISLVLLYMYIEFFRNADANGVHFYRDVSPVKICRPWGSEENGGSFDFPRDAEKIIKKRGKVLSDGKYLTHANSVREKLYQEIAKALKSGGVNFYPISPEMSIGEPEVTSFTLKREALEHYIDNTVEAIPNNEGYKSADLEIWLMEDFGRVHIKNLERVPFRSANEIEPEPWRFRVTPVSVGTESVSVHLLMLREQSWHVFSSPKSILLDIPVLKMDTVIKRRSLLGVENIGLFYGSISSSSLMFATLSWMGIEKIKRRRKIRNKIDKEFQSTSPPSLRHLLSATLSETDVANLWFDVFGTKISDEYPGVGINQSVINLIDKARKTGEWNRLELMLKMNVFYVWEIARRNGLLGNSDI